jgi:hypothetical protein
MSVDYIPRPDAPHPFGLQFTSRHGRFKQTDWWNMDASVPYWLPVAVLSVLPAYCGWRQYKMNRLAKKGYCARCGYDLRATPDRCPECGMVPPKKEIVSH